MEKLLLQFELFSGFGLSKHLYQVVLALACETWTPTAGQIGHISSLLMAVPWSADDRL